MESEADSAMLNGRLLDQKSQACSDQFASGKPIGSLYYPRIVTNILWLEADTMKRGKENLSDSRRVEGVVA